MINFSVYLNRHVFVMDSVLLSLFIYSSVICKAVYAQGVCVCVCVGGGGERERGGGRGEGGWRYS